MRTLALLLHFYQPPTQSQTVTEQVLRSCYLPLADLLLAHPEAELTLNISGSLLEDINAIADHAFVEKMKILLGRKQVELANSPIYHPLLPLISAPEIATHLDINRKTLQANFQTEPAEVIFPPEMAVKPEALSSVAESTSTKQVIVLVDESSVNPHFSMARIPKDQVYSLNNLSLAASSRTVTEVIRSYHGELTAEKFLKFLDGQTNADQTIIAVADAEIFGHHYTERINLLKELFEGKKIRFAKITNAVRSAAGPKNISLDQITASTWQTSPEDLKNNNPYPLWLNPANHLQAGYNELAELAHQSWQKSPNPNPVADNFYFRGISSCHYYWLSNWPWWHPDLVETGARELIKCIRSLQIDREWKARAEKVYHEFLMKMWDYHWSGEVEKKYKEYDEQRQKFLSGLVAV